MQTFFAKSHFNSRSEFVPFIANFETFSENLQDNCGTTNDVRGVFPCILRTVPINKDSDQSVSSCLLAYLACNLAPAITTGVRNCGYKKFWSAVGPTT